MWCDDIFESANKRCWPQVMFKLYKLKNLFFIFTIGLKPNKQKLYKHFFYLLYSNLIIKKTSNWRKIKILASFQNICNHKIYSRIFQTFEAGLKVAVWGPIHYYIAIAVPIPQIETSSFYLRDCRIIQLIQL